MRVKLVAVGTKLPQWVDAGFLEYTKRLPKEFSIELIEVLLAHRGKNPDLARLIHQEGQAMLKHVNDSDWVIALEVNGKRWSTEQLAEQITNWQMNGKDVVLLVGGPDGLSNECKSRANIQWSLSELTLPHPLVRIILAESLYRAWTLTVGHPYHRK